MKTTPTEAVMASIQGGMCSDREISKRNRGRLTYPAPPTARVVGNQAKEPWLDDETLLPESGQPESGLRTPFFRHFLADVVFDQQGECWVHRARDDCDDLFRADLVLLVDGARKREGRIDRHREGEGEGEGDELVGSKLRNRFEINLQIFREDLLHVCSKVVDEHIYYNNK